MPVRRSHDRLYPEPPVEGELPRPDQTVAAGPLTAGRDANKRVRTSEAAAALARMPRRSRFLPKKYTCDPRFEPFNRSRIEWLAKRRSEVCTATGGVSHGVGAMLNAAAWSYAAGEFLSSLAAERGDADLFRQAANLTTTARGHDRMAWELAVLEAQTRRDEDEVARARREINGGAS